MLHSLPRVKDPFIGMLQQGSHQTRLGPGDATMTSSDNATVQLSATAALGYAITYWPLHIQRQQPEQIDRDVVNKLKRFLGSMRQSSRFYKAWAGHIKQSPEVEEIETFRGTRKVSVEMIEPSDTVIFALCAFGIYDLLSDWWNLGPTDLQRRNGKKELVLHVAIYGGSCALVEKLLDLGVDANATAPDGQGSPLLLATRCGHVDIVRALLEHDAKVSDGNGDEALIEAVRKGYVEIVEALLDYDANPDAESNDVSEPALVDAASAANERIVWLLLDKGAEPDKQSQQYGTAMQAAIASTIPKSGVVDGFSPFEVVRLLINFGADINAEGRFHESALAAAIWYKNEPIQQLLRQKGAIEPAVNAEAQATGGADQSDDEDITEGMSDDSSEDSSEED